jgi:hypothetical protein
MKNNLFSLKSIEVGQVYILKHREFREFDSKNLHPKLIFNKETYYCFALPGTSKSRQQDEVLTIPSKEFDKNADSFKYTHFIYKFGRNIPNGEFILKGKLIGGPTKKIIEEIKKFKSYS